VPYNPLSRKCGFRNLRRGDWFRKEKPRRVTGLKADRGPGDSTRAPPLDVRRPTRPNWAAPPLACTLFATLLKDR
jgi:hypothetical protein